MNRAKHTLWAGTLLWFALLATGASAQTNCNEGAGPLNNEQPKGTTLEAIIQKFSSQEGLFKEAQTHYTFTEDVSIQTLQGEDVDGEFRRVSDISFRSGKRFSYVTFAPQTSLRRISMEKEDFDDIENYSSFILTQENLPKYSVLYIGRQKVDEIEAYVLDVAPRQLEPGKRYFQGRIWVDDHDLQIVKTCGKNVPERAPSADQQKKKKKKKQIPQESVSPTVVTYREQIDGKYWFPTYVRSDETLHFIYGNDIHIREVIKYLRYKRAETQAGSAVVQAQQP